MTAGPEGHDDAGKGGKLPGNRARTLILLTVLVVVAVLITFMLLVSQIGR